MEISLGNFSATFLPQSQSLGGLLANNPGLGAALAATTIIGGGPEDLAIYPVAAFEIAAAEGAGLLEGPAAGTLQAWSGTITSGAVPEGGMTAYRVWGGDAQLTGAWLSPIPMESASMARSLLALPPENSAAFMSTVEIPAGTQIEYGTAASAFEQAGGGIQIRSLGEIPTANFGAGVPLSP